MISHLGQPAPHIAASSGSLTTNLECTNGSVIGRLADLARARRFPHRFHGIVVIKKLKDRRDPLISKKFELTNSLKAAFADR